MGIWSFCYAKQKNVPEEYQGTFGSGDVWTWVAIDADTKLIPSWLVGERTTRDLYTFLSDLKAGSSPAASGQYRPMLILARVLEKEKEHVVGFAPEVAVVTYAGGEELGEPLVVRPTSETIIWDIYARWVQSYRDLPLLYNQWCNIVRWEMRPRLFLRTTEFLWQERAYGARDAGGGVDRDEADARRVPAGGRGRDGDARAHVTQDACRALPRRGGDAHDRGPHARREGLQSGTSHYLGENFARAYGVTFLGRDGEEHYAQAMSWGSSTRLVGGLIMAHGDQKGLRLPPLVAPVQVVIVPIYRSDDERSQVVTAVGRMAEEWRWAGFRIRVDDRDDLRPGFKFADHELRGIPIRIEVGPRDLEAEQVTVVRRDTSEKSSMPTTAFGLRLPILLDEIQQSLFDDALAFRDAHTHEVSSYDELRDVIGADGGFAVGAWCGHPDCEAKVKAETKATIRFLPLEQEDPESPCSVCGSPGTEKATWAIAY